MRNGFKHEVPLSLQFRPFKNFSISPQVSYTGVLYTQKIEKYGILIMSILQQTRYPPIVTDTLRGTFYGHAINPSISASYNPQIFGTYNFKPESRVQAIPTCCKTISQFQLYPFLKGLNSDLYRKVQRDTLGNFTGIFDF